MKILFFKAKDSVQVRGYTRKDGTFVNPHSAMHEKAEISGSDYKPGDRFVTVFGDKYTAVGPDPKSADRILAREDGVPDKPGFYSSVKIENIKAGKPAAAKKKKEPGGKVDLYHGSYEKKIDEIRGDDIGGGVFRGLFAGSLKVAMSHGDYVHKIEVDADKILDHDTSRNLSGKALATANREIKSHLRGKYSRSEFESIRDAVLEDHNIGDMDAERVAEITGWIDDPSAVTWQIQMLRGRVAAALGYHGVEMRDEHGTTTLVLPGAQVKPHKQ